MSDAVSSWLWAVMLDAECKTRLLVISELSPA